MRQEHEDLVRAVAAIGAMKARVSMKKSTVPAALNPKEKKTGTSARPTFSACRREEEGDFFA